MSTCIGCLPAWRVVLFVCGFEGLGIWNSPRRTCSRWKHETDWAARGLEWCDMLPICNWACNTQHSCLWCPWCCFHLKPHTGLSTILSPFFSIASWCLFRISLLCSAFLKYFLFLSLPNTCLFLEILSFFNFFSLLPSFSLFSPLLVLCPSPPSSSHRYLTPGFKAEFYDVTKWVEDVNRNTQGPYLRYYLRPCPVPHTLLQNPPHFWFYLWLGQGK